MSADTEIQKLLNELSSNLNKSETSNIYKFLYSIAEEAVFFQDQEANLISEIFYFINIAQ